MQWRAETALIDTRPHERQKQRDKHISDDRQEGEEGLAVLATVRYHGGDDVIAIKVRRLFPDFPDQKLSDCLTADLTVLC